ncbi:MAG: sigma-54-dependent Fis family transcriptional regulator [Gammaproteobacteria bacterium]|nr:sigma-54-dependent Fis family transcriptional regulator [Gammaproteobacteria bacterium]
MSRASSPGAGAATQQLLLGSSAAMVSLRAQVRQLAQSPFPVLVSGESGTGKELVAQCLHREGPRAAAPLVTLNCAAFTPELLAAQLFGHARGAYTGAEQARAGFFEAAGGGTLLLDEVGEIPPALQAKLLRVLENGEYYRLGETQARRAAARIVAATNRDLRTAVQRGEFRADLFHRLSVLQVNVPPLRERADDWQLLLAHFQQAYAAQGSPFSLAPAAARRLASYGFAGNVRELRNLVIRLGCRYPGACVADADLQAELEPAPCAPDDGPAATGLAARLCAGEFRLAEELADVERCYVALALALKPHNFAHAARLLGVNRTTLYSKLARLGLTSPLE